MLLSIINNNNNKYYFYKCKEHNVNDVESCH